MQDANNSQSLRQTRDTPYESSPVTTYQWDISTPQSFASPSLQHSNKKKNKSPCMSCKQSHVKCRMSVREDGFEMCERCITRGMECKPNVCKRDILKQTVPSKNDPGFRLGLEITTALDSNSRLLSNTGGIADASDSEQHNLPTIVHNSEGLLKHGEPSITTSPFSELTIADFDNDLADKFSESLNPYSPTSTLYGSDQVDLCEEEYYYS